jgi:serine-type D-Ala-D-Ala carboxypeptidase (penicillin-binding protein 5/6)
MSSSPRGKIAARAAAGLAALVIAAIPAGAAGQKAGSGGTAGPETPAASGPPQIDARAWILVDPRDGEMLASNAAEKPRPIASATKLMTAYLALKNLKPQQTLEAAPYNALPAESLVGLRPGEKMKVKDLLYALLLPSANDAAATLAQGVAGNTPKFVARMNAAAQELGLDDTSYANPIGLDAPDNYSSAADLVTLATKLRENALFARIVASPSAVLRSGDRPRSITSRNTLLMKDPSADGVKTGHTVGAGYVLVGSATREGTTLISAVLGAKSEAARDAETEELLNYGFSLYRASTPVTAGEELADPELDYRDEHLPLLARNAIEVSAREGQPVETTIEAPDEISGAVEKGEPLGKAVVTVDGRVAASTPLMAANSAEAATLLDKVVATVQNPVVLLGVGAFVIVVGVLFALRGRRPEDEAEPQPEATQHALVPSPPTTEEKPAQGKITRRKAKERKPKQKGPRERTPEERRKMHEQRMKRRAERAAKRRGDW